MHFLKLITGYAIVVVTGAMVVGALAEKREMESRRECLQREATEVRKPDYPIQECFVNRWSSYAFEPVSLKKDEINIIFCAASFAPSSFNEQPWRFVFAQRETANWDTMFQLLVPFNQAWAKNASLLIMVISKKNFSHNNEFSPTHAFDCGAAWQNLALQAHHMGLITHGMAGFDRQKAREVYAIADEYEIHAIIAVGKPGNPDLLPDDLKEKQKPSLRKPIKEFVYEGSFKP